MAHAETTPRRRYVRVRKSVPRTEPSGRVPGHIRRSAGQRHNLQVLRRWLVPPAATMAPLPMLGETFPNKTIVM